MRDWLKKLRLQQEKTQNEIAEASGVGRAYYTMIELGTRNPSVEVAKQIAKVLGFKWTIFFENECNETKHFESKEVG